MEAYTIISYTISYFSFLALLWLSKMRGGLRFFDENGFASNPVFLIILHVGGILLFLLLPAILGHTEAWKYTDAIDMKLLPAMTTIVLAILIVAFSNRLAKKKFRELIIDTALPQAFSTRFLFSYFFLRIIFICGYENWFRGYLLFDCVDKFGTPIAVFINVSLYTLLHVVNGKQEVLACIPFGILLCAICLWQGSPWPAIIIHLSLTITYEVGFIRRMNVFKQAAT